MPPISSASLLEKLHQQRPVLDAQMEEFADAGPVINLFHARFEEILRSHPECGSPEDMVGLCAELDTASASILGSEAPAVLGHGLERHLRQTLQRRILRARTRMRRVLEIQAGWHQNEATRFGADINVLRSNLGLAELPLPPPSDEQVLELLPLAERNAYQSMIEELQLDPALLVHLLSVLHPNHFRNADDETIETLGEFLGVCEQTRRPFVLPSISVDVLRNPRATWFRKILFDQYRDRHFPTFKEKGLEAVWDALHAESAAVTEREREQLSQVRNDENAILAVRQEHAIKRRFTSALMQYFLDLETMDGTPRLREKIGGDRFPGLHQKVAAFETINFGDRFYNGGPTGSGKTGASIYTTELLMELQRARKAVVICPASVVPEWRKGLSDDPECGYFKSGQSRKVVVISSKQKRAHQWEQARDADYVVISIEMCRKETQGLPHREWIKQLHPEILIIDEGHRIKNTEERENSDRAIIMDVAQHCPIRICNSATPIENTTVDLAAAIQLMNIEPEGAPPSELHHAFDAYIERCADNGDREILATLPDLTNGPPYRDVDFRDVRLLRSMIDRGNPICPMSFLPHFYRPPQAVCLPIASRLEVTDEICDPSPREQVAYDQVRSRRNINAIHKMQRLLRTMLHPYALPENPHTGESKFRAACRWLDRFYDDEGKTHVVFSSPVFKKGVTRDTDYAADTNLFEQFRQRYEALGVTVVRLDGQNSGHVAMPNAPLMNGQPATRTQQIIDEFLRAAKGLLVSHMQVINLGTNQLASGVSRAILASPPWTQSAKQQWIGRYHRRGQTDDTVRVVTLISSGLEEGIDLVSRIKQERADRYLNGRQPTEADRRLFAVQTGRTPNRRVLSWYTMSEIELFSYLCQLMSGRGREFIAEGLGELFAQLYNRNWETSYNGDAQRLVAGVIENLLPSIRQNKSDGRYVEIADIASGSFGVARTLRDNPNVRVWSSDLNPAMVTETIGQSVLGEQYQPELIDVCAMDELPYENNSKDVAVLSLAWDCAMHSERPRHAGREAIRTGLELHRILTKNGTGIITLPPGIFKGRHSRRRFARVCSALSHFGFQVISELSGHARAATTEEEDPFDIYVFTVRKTGEPSFREDAPWEDLPADVRQGLRFRIREETAGTGRRRRQRNAPREERGAYHDLFTIENDEQRNTTVEFTPSEEQELTKRRSQEKRRIMQSCPETVRALLRRHPTIEEVPHQIWRQLALDDVLDSPATIREAFMNALTATIGEAVERELDAVNASQQKGSVAVQSQAKGGRFLVLCNAEGHPFGTKYFLERAGNGNGTH
ncbi:MAG: SNF2-related protein [Candidatus Peribacteraceae bacterium]|nr:SNF2-related protein [Candidatus Peribacteraceae bacterium]